MPHTVLSRSELAVAVTLRKHRPEVSGDSRDALERVHWFEIVRDTADALFGRPGVYASTTRLGEKWHEFCNMAGYFSA